MMINVSVRRGIVLVVTVTMLSLFASCRKAGSPDDTIFHAINYTPFLSLDPSVEQSNGTGILHNVYETLTVYDDIEQQVKPCLAESWSSNAIKTTWTFKLRRDVMFHDGTPLTAFAVKKSIDRAMLIGTGASYIWNCVSSIQAVDDLTVVFKLKYAAPLPLILSSGTSAFILSPKAVNMEESWFNAGNDAGSGPYRVVAVSKTSVTLEAFEGYRGGWSKNKYKRVFISEIPDKNRSTDYLEEGDADIVFFPDVDRIRRLEKTMEVPGCTVETGKSWFSVIMMFNTEKTPCSNEYFRKALACAFPYEETVNKILKGEASLAKGMVPDGLWSHDEGLDSYSLDMVKSREYLSLSGFQGASLTLTYQTGRPELDDALEIFKRNLAQIGVDLILLKVDWETQQKTAVSENPASRQDILVMDWWPDYADPAGTFQPLLADQGLDNGFNYSYLHDAHLMQAIQNAQMLTLEDQNRAADIYVDLQKKVLEHCYMIFLYDSATPIGVKRGLKGVRINPAYGSCVYYYDVERMR
ncbi:MAG: ABC transporter substrate-binding protein [Treponema sp.]|nr:ABC transporter substrate-binding protein [Treponema sp.]